MKDRTGAELEKFDIVIHNECAFVVIGFTKKYVKLYDLSPYNPGHWVCRIKPENLFKTGKKQYTQPNIF